MDEPREPAPKMADATEPDTTDEAEWEWALELEDDEPRLSSLDRPPRVGGAEARTRGRWWARQWRWTLRLGALAASVALVCALAITLMPLLAPLIPRPIASAARSDILALNLAPGLSVCATTGYWSPDGRSIAVLRSPSVCGITPREPDVYIYDAASGEQTATYHVTAPVRVALARAGAGAWTITYDQLAWAPNQRALAVLFHAQPSPTTPGARAILPGLALITPGRSPTNAVAITLASPRSAGETAQAPAGQVAGTLWDTRQGSVRTQAIPVAQAYDWLPDDSLIATEPYPGSGDTSSTSIPSFSWRPFSAWRTGTLSVANTAQCAGRSGANPPTPFALLTLSVATWSLDSRYLFAFQTRARAAAPTIPLDATAHDCLSSAEVNALPLTPIHDRAALAALRLLGASDAEQMTLLWSPDGKRMAAISSGPAISPTAATIYDTATGLILTRIIAGQSQIPGAQGADASAIITGAAWSPNGSRLLVAITGLRFNIRVYSGHALG